MKSCLIVLLVVVYVAAALAEEKKKENCFKDGEFDKARKERFMKKNGPLMEKCKKENATATEGGCIKQVFRKWKTASKECKGEAEKNGTKRDWKKKWDCFKQKSGIAKLEFKIEEYKTKMASMALPEKKKTVEDAITPCASEKGHLGLWCSLKNLRKVCPEMTLKWHFEKRGKGEKGEKGGKGGKGGKEGKEEKGGKGGKEEEEEHPED